MHRQDEFLKLLLTHQTGLKAFIGAVVLDRHWRDDVFQEVAVTLWQQLDTYDWDRPFGAWARGIAARKILQLRDQNARFPTVLSPETMQAVLAEFDATDAPAPARVDALRGCLQDLPAHARQLLALRYERNLSCTTIAAETGRSVAAVYQTLSRVRARLEECIRQRLAHEVFA